MSNRQSRPRTNPTNSCGIMDDMTSHSSRAILAANLRRMIELDTQRGVKPSVRAWALGKGLEVRMIDRLVKGQHAVTLDKLEDIAAACGVKPWHLLFEDMNPADLPAAPISDEERAMLAKLRRLLAR